jgi:cytochrome c oxidase subunit 2
MRLTGKIIKLICLTAMVTTICIADLALAQETGQEERVIQITAKKFEYSPNEIRLKKGVPVVLALTSLDRLHGFNIFDFGVRADINPGQVSRVRIVPEKAGTFVFRCDIYCGEGHEGMEGKLIVEE